MKNYNLTFTQQELDTIGEALLDKPARTSMPVINSINSQIAVLMQEEQIATQEKKPTTTKRTNKK